MSAQDEAFERSIEIENITGRCDSVLVAVTPCEPGDRTEGALYAIEKTLDSVVDGDIITVANGFRKCDFDAMHECLGKIRDHLRTAEAKLDYVVNAVARKETNAIDLQTAITELASKKEELSPAESVMIREMLKTLGVGDMPF